MKKQAITRLVSILLIMSLSIGLVSCYGETVDTEKEIKTKEFTVKIDALESKLKKLLTDPNASDPEKVQETLKTILETNQALQDAKQALVDLKASGGSWYDIGKGALGGIFGRTLLHAVRTALIAFFPGSAGGGLAMMLTMILGGSGPGADNKKKTLL